MLSFHYVSTYECSMIRDFQSWMFYRHFFFRAERSENAHLDQQGEYTVSRCVLSPEIEKEQ